MPSWRPVMRFRMVNRPGQPGFKPDMQRHHLLPCQVLGREVFGRLVERLGRDTIGFEDFRRNGLLLPATEAATRRTMLPLHRGPHRLYNEVVAERIGQIELGWQSARSTSSGDADFKALMRLDLLQRALRRRLLAPDRKPIRLNLKDPLGCSLDFAGLDALADSLWAATAPVGEESR